MDFTKFFPLPVVASAHGHEVDLVIYLIHALMFVLFLGWGFFFIFTLIRFRKGKNPKASYTGVKNHISSYVEVGVALFEAMILIGLSIPFWSKQVNAFPTRTDTMEVRIVAEQFAWNVHYPGPDKKFGKADPKFYDKQSNPLALDRQDPNGKDDVVTINQLYLPIGNPVIIHLTSRDVIHCFSVPAMRVKQDILPGMSIPLWFTPTKRGKYEIACAQLCGIGHYRMKGYLTVESQEEFDSWLAQQISANAESGGDDDFWN
ncbi:MAG: cupredoxin domain-containing protein [Candidatus Omnitrophica bacterium]|nr:cupredoxin domain-containing protein [Candidatus Omnitrophota bacterium]